MKGQRRDGPPGGVHLGGGGCGGRYQRCRGGWRGNGRGRALRGHQTVQQLLLGVERLLHEAGLETVEIVPLGRLPGMVGLAAIAGLNRINRGRWRFLTELPVRSLYVLIQSVAELLDHLFAGSQEVVAHVVVARRMPPSTGE